MKSLWLSKKRHGSREAPRLSLFPFLAVLICTMGALMLLLLYVTRQVRLQVAREAASKGAEKQSKIAGELEMVQWRVDQLRSSRKATSAELADARLVLGHIEDHSRRLRSQFATLTEQAKKAAAEGLKPGNFVSPGEDELRQLDSQIAAVQQRLVQSQQSAAERPKSYAIVPYDGPNSTRRRPIYIECRSDAVVLQPENISFGEADFDEPLGPGNPLAAAARAAREQMLAERRVDPRNDGEPYPLLLVRPDGILAYECALAAMKSWGSDYGYELVNADWQLKYPPADPSVARSVAQAVELARQEHARLIAAAPSKYGKRPRPGAYRSTLASSGGDGGQGGGGDGGSPGFYSSKPSDRSGSRYASNGTSGHDSEGRGGSGNGNGSGSGNSGRGRGGGGDGTGSFAGGGSGGLGIGSDGIGHDGGAQSADEEFAANNPYESMALPGGGSGGGRPRGSGGLSSSGGPGGGGGVGGALGGTANAVGNGSGGSPGGTGYGDVAGTNMTGANVTGASASGTPTIYSPSFGQPGGSNRAQTSPGPSSPAGSQANGAAVNQANGQFANQADGQPAGQVAPGGIARPEGYVTGRPSDVNPNPQPPQRYDPPSGVAMVPNTPLRPGEWRPSDDSSPPKPDPEEEKKKKKKHPYDDVKPDHNMADWALRNARNHAAAISRPVHIDCLSDRLVIAADQPGGESHVILIGRDGQDNADKLVTAIWEVMDSWGMAGREMYWRPVLNFYVAPGAESQMFDMTRALDGSGMVIERKK